MTRENTSSLVWTTSSYRLVISPDHLWGLIIILKHSYSTYWWWLIFNHRYWVVAIFLLMYTSVIIGGRVSLQVLPALQALPLPADQEGEHCGELNRRQTHKNTREFVLTYYYRHPHTHTHTNTHTHAHAHAYEHTQIYILCKSLRTWPLSSPRSTVRLSLA